MNGTPRLHASFPSTPQTRPTPRSVPSRRPIPKHKLPPAQASSGALSPVIPADLVDPTTQRLFAFAIWVLLWAWKASDWIRLYNSDDAESLWLFMKWILIDGIFIFGLPILSIPWLEFSSAAMTINFLIHAGLDAMLMFQIGLPLGALLHGLVKLVWDRGELIVSERMIQAQRVVDPSSLIQGKQIIHILPEGSATLNPDNQVFCIGGDTLHVALPIQINQTRPVLIELLRRDFSDQTSETLTIKAKEAKNLRYVAADLHKRSKGPLKSSDALVLRYQVKKPGQYTIRRLIDESNLQVRPKRSEVLVVPCPSAKIVTDSTDRCRGDLSNIAFEVTGTPPLKLKYRKLANGNPIHASFQSIQPADFVSPYIGQRHVQAPGHETYDFTWARPQNVLVPINESMVSLGKYSYYIDDVEDALGNHVGYLNPGADEEEGSTPNFSHGDVNKLITVHDRPSIWIPTAAGCNAEKPLRVAAGKEVSLPHNIASVGQTELDATQHDYAVNDPHTIKYDFFPVTALQQGTGKPIPGVAAVSRAVKVRKKNEDISIKEPGLYVLTHISTQYCAGEVSEPSSCLLQNPERPSVKISSTEITDNCANNPIGLETVFDFQGTPPFLVRFTEEQVGSKTSPRMKSVTFDSHRGRLQLRQQAAGSFKYTFKEITDLYYEAEPLNQVLTQDVKPSAYAILDEQASPKHKNVCLGSSTSITVRLMGEPPWSLEYELINGKSRQKLSQSNITQFIHEVDLPVFTAGGQYTVALTSVVDASGCKEFLKHETKFHVWGQKPTGAFGRVKNAYEASILEGNSIRLPLKFAGQPPFRYLLGRMEGQDIMETLVFTSTSAAAVHTVQQAGTYVMVDTSDNYCPGEVEVPGNQFTVAWVPRPDLTIAQHPTIEQQSTRFTKADICEGDEDSIDLKLTGSPPFVVKYSELVKPDEGQKSTVLHVINPPFGKANIKLHTSNAGTLEYKFQEVADVNYDADSKRLNQVTLQQRVLPRPSAKFINSGSAYSFCSTDGSSDEVVPIKFTGTPPFSVDIDILHSGSASPESLSFDSIASTSYNLRIPLEYLRSGQSSLTIRRVRDGHGCQSKVDTSQPPSRIHISVHDPPSIVPIQPRTNFCVGDYVSFRLSGVPPFIVTYTFAGETRRAVERSTIFKRLNALPGTFTIIAISDSSSKCRFSISLSKTIHPLPGVKISSGKEVTVDILEGSETDLLFEFSGSPPFELVYTRSQYSVSNKKAKRIGGASLSSPGGIAVLETKTAQTNDYTLRIKESEEGEYEAISVRDRWCMTSKNGAAAGSAGSGAGLVEDISSDQKLLN